MREDRTRGGDEAGFAAGVFDAPRRDVPERDRSPEPPRDSGRSPRAGSDRGEDVPRGGDGGDDGGERRPRRRRGRRGGRGRRPRDGERVEAGGRERSDDEPLRDDLAGPAVRPARPDDLWDGERPAESPERTDGADRPERGDDDDAAPRRRRRGRRGGRGRSRAGRGTGEGRSADAPPAAEGDVPERRGTTGDDDADEPLPGGYGVRPPAARTDGNDRGGRSTASRSAEPGSDSEGGGRSRRRGRRRRSGDSVASSNGGEGSGSGEGSRRSSRSRRERRPGGEPRGESRSDGGFSRRRRSDFAPVGSGHDEDDEGLEFLGLDESGADTPRRDARPAADDILVESGLASVQDVPSWVEAIGIVIAGNLDARSRSNRGDDSRRGGR